MCRYTAVSHSFEYKQLGAKSCKTVTEPRLAVGITGSPAAIDRIGGVDQNGYSLGDVNLAKAEREKFFPIKLLKSAIEFKCVDGEASVRDDKTKIMDRIQIEVQDNTSAQNQGLRYQTDVLDSGVHGLVAAAALQRVLKVGEQVACFADAVRHGVRNMVINLPGASRSLPESLDTDSNLSMLLREDAVYRTLLLHTKCISLPRSLWSISTIITLDLCAPNLRELPAGIHSMSSLKHLTLRSCSLLESLPEQVADLNLRLLNIRECINLSSLPQKVTDMCARHTYIKITGTNKLSQLPEVQNLNSEVAKLDCIPELVGWFRLPDDDVLNLAVDSLAVGSLAVGSVGDLLLPSQAFQGKVLLLESLGYKEARVRAAAVKVFDRLSAEDLNKKKSAYADYLLNVCRSVIQPVTQPVTQSVTQPVTQPASQPATAAATHSCSTWPLTFSHQHSATHSFTQPLIQQLTCCVCAGVLQVVWKQMPSEC